MVCRSPCAPATVTRQPSPPPAPPAPACSSWSCTSRTRAPSQTVTRPATERTPKLGISHVLLLACHSAAHTPLVALALRALEHCARPTLTQRVCPKSQPTLHVRTWHKDTDRQEERPEHVQADGGVLRAGAFLPRTCRLAAGCSAVGSAPNTLRCQRGTSLKHCPHAACHNACPQPQRGSVNMPLEHPAPGRHNCSVLRTVGRDASEGMVNARGRGGASCDSLLRIQDGVVGKVYRPHLEFPLHVCQGSLLEAGGGAGRGGKGIGAAEKG